MPVTVSEFTLHFTAANDTTGAPTGVEVVGYGEVFEVVGNRLVGKEGTAFEGLDLAYSGDPSTTPADITVHVTNGVGERVYQTANTHTLPGTGKNAAQISDTQEPKH